jgi:hypothetical protein
MDPAVAVYFGGGTLLFFFWVYGIVAFVRDLRGRYLPALRQYRRGREQQQAEAERREEREEREQQLY